MRPESLKLLHDMHQAAADVTPFASGRTFDQYRADKQLRMAVERGLEIIGEALSQLCKIDPSTAQRITGLAGNYRIPQCPDPRLRSDSSR